MKKTYIFSLLMLVCSISYAEQIRVRILYNIPKKEITSILVNTTDPYKKMKCEAKAMSEESRKLMHYLTRNKKEEVIILTQICTI